MGAEVTLAGNGVEEDQIFFEGFGAGGDAAVGHEGHAGAIENQAVIAADLIHVHDRDAIFPGDVLQHVVAQRALVDGVG